MTILYWPELSSQNLHFNRATSNQTVDIACTEGQQLKWGIWRGSGANAHKG